MDTWATEYIKVSATPLQRMTYPVTSFAKGFGQSAKTIPKEAVQGVASLGRSTAKQVVDVAKNPGAFAASQAKQWAIGAGATAIDPTLGAIVGTYQNVPWGLVRDTGRAIGRTVVKPFDAGISRSLRLRSRLKPDALDRLGAKVDSTASNTLLRLI